MAIEKMKKLRVIALRQNKKALLRALMRLGCLQVVDCSQKLMSDATLTGVVSEKNHASIVRSEQGKIKNAIDFMERLYPAKKPLLAPKSEMDPEIYLNQEDVGEAREVAEAVLTIEKRLQQIDGEIAAKAITITALEPWCSLDLHLEMTETETCGILRGSFPIKKDLTAIESKLRETFDAFVLFPISEDSHQQYVLTICLKDVMPNLVSSMRDFGYNDLTFSGMVGTAKENVYLCEKAIEDLKTEKQIQFEKLKEKVGCIETLKRAADELGTHIGYQEACAQMAGTESTVILEGWIPADCTEDIRAVMTRYECAWEIVDPEEAEYPEVPVRLRNNMFTNALNMVTDMYSLPAYGTVDPNPLMAPFFILFFGLMMADMGYGIIMILAAVIAMRKLKPREGTLAFCELLLYGGIATFAMGFLTGGFFSDIPYQLVHLFHPDSTWEGLWHLFSPETDSTMVLYGSMILGVLHLNTGMVVNFVQKWKKGQKFSAIFEEGSLWVILVGGLLAVFGIGNIAGVPAVLVIGIVALLFGAGREAKGFGKVTAAFGCIYNTATGWFGDVLSYSRIMALMLAGGVVGKVFNTVAVMPAQSSGVNVGSMIAFVVIFLLGHAMNFALNLLGCYVHDLRLQCLEFFGKFYEDGGKAFKPLKVSEEYYRVKM